MMESVAVVPDATLTFNCWVRGSSVDRIFEVEISSVKTVTALKKAIKNEKPADFSNIEADALKLYPTFPPDDDDALESFLNNWTSDGKRHLAGLKRLSDLNLSDSLIVVDGVRSFNCWVRGQDASSNFRIDIASTKTIADLKEAIKKNEPTFCETGANSLTLYKPRHPVSLPYEKSLSTFILSEHAEPLSGELELSEAFPGMPPKHDIHVIVDAPSVILCYLRGVDTNIDAGFPISIQPNPDIGRFITRTKQVYSQLKDTADIDIHLYKLSGNESELLESLNRMGDGERLQGAAFMSKFLDVPVLALLRVVVEVSAKNRVDPIAAARKNFILEHAPKPSSDSSTPSESRKMQGKEAFQIIRGSPPYPQEVIPITLLHPVFGEFEDDCRTGRMKEDDNQFSGRLANLMSDFYTVEWSRKKMVYELFQEFHIDIDYGTKFLGMWHRFSSGLSAEIIELPYLISEVTKEAVVFDWESYTMQGVLHYLEATKAFALKWSKSTLPCFLLVIVGPYVMFAGAVWNARPVVRMLSVPLALHYHFTDAENQLGVARHFAAFRKALKKLKRFYEDLEADRVKEHQFDDILFPYPTTFNSLKDQTLQTIRYTKQLDEGGEKKKLIFFGTLEGHPSLRICIKFTRRYSKEAHLHCADSGFAPRLQGFEMLPGGWRMVVMDELVGYDLLANLPNTERIPRSALDAVETQLKRLHGSGLVHGDIREANVFVNKDRTKLMIIDFDWGGTEGTVGYPPRVNYASVRRPQEARDGLLIKAEHDLEMLGFITETRAAESL